MYCSQSKKLVNEVLSVNTKLKLAFQTVPFKFFILIGLEFILLNNPYTDKRQNFVKLKLNYQGNPRSNAQVMVFERSLDNTVSIFTTKTSKDGIIKIPVKKGYDYLFDAVKLRKANPSSKLKAVWETLWAALMISIPLE